MCLHQTASRNVEYRIHKWRRWGDCGGIIASEHGCQPSLLSTSSTGGHVTQQQRQQQQWRRRNCHCRGIVTEWRRLSRARYAGWHPDQPAARDTYVYPVYILHVNVRCTSQDALAMHNFQSPQTASPPVPRLSDERRRVHASSRGTAEPAGNPEPRRQPAARLARRPVQRAPRRHPAARLLLRCGLTNGEDGSVAGSASVWRDTL